MKEKRGEKGQPFIRTAFLIIPTVLAYILTLKAPLHFDAKQAFLAGPALHNPLDFESIINIDPYLPRPLFHFSLALDWHFWGTRGIHLSNILWHLAAVILFWRVIESLLEGREKASEISFASALFFALHPVLTESVTYTWGRSGVMSAVFMLAAMLAFIESLKGDKIRWSLYAASIFSFLPALLSKETAAVLPLILAVVALWGGITEKRRRSMLLVWPFFIIVFLELAWRYATYGRLAFGSDGPYISHLATQACVTMDYLRLLLWPVGLSIDHYVPDKCSALKLGLAVIIIPAMLASVILTGRERMELKYAAAFFIIGLLPYLVVPLKDRMVERNLYVPAMGFAISLAYVVMYAGRNYRIILPALVAVCLMALTISRNTVWSSEVSIWSDAARKSPDIVRPKVQLGALALADGDERLARDYLFDALRLNSENADLHNNLGVFFAGKGDLERAAWEFSLAINIDNEDAEAHMNYVSALLKLGKVPEAAGHLKKIVDRWPTLTEAKVLLAEVYRTMGRTDESVELFSEAMNADPGDGKIAVGLALAYLQKGKPDEAQKWIGEALKINPYDSKAHRVQGMLLMRETKYSEAIEEYKSSFRLSRTKDPDILADLGIAYLQAGDFDKARETFMAELELRPDSPLPYMRLGLLEEKAGNQLEARANYFKAGVLDKEGKYTHDIEQRLKALGESLRNDEKDNPDKQ